MIKIFIDRATNIHYASYYIKGLYEVCGRNNVKYSNKYFKNFKHNNDYFSFVVKDKTKTKKVVIDFGDSSSIYNEALIWSDCYFKVNLDLNEVNKSSKIISIGPSFGIKLYSLLDTIWYASINLLLGYSRILNKKRFLSDYKAQLQRLKLEDYYPSKSQNGFIFFVASLWKKEGRTNFFRSNFIKACLRNNMVEFEGGFAPRTKKDIVGFESLTMRKRVNLDVFVSKTKKSEVVFNTPAILNCHGWKLGEFLCLGKAIISTPISRQLPEQLVDNTHVVITNGEEKDISYLLNNLLHDKEKLRCLEENARNYFEMYLEPQVVISKIIKYKVL